MEREKIPVVEKPLSPEEQEILEQEEKKKKNWKQKNAEMVILRRNIIRGVSELFKKGIIANQFGVEGYMEYVIGPELQKHFIDINLQEYALKHAFLGSTPEYDWSPDIDLPDDQIMNFAKDLLEKIRIANETGKFEI